MSKRALRKEIFARRDSLTAEEILAKSRDIAQQLARLPFYQKEESQTIMFFFRSEGDPRDG